MPDADATPGKGFAPDVPQETPGFFLKGSAHLGWGMKSRLSSIFDPESGRTVMLAFDHGYIMGPTSGIERLDLAIPPLVPYADTLMCTRGGLVSCIPPESRSRRSTPPYRPSYTTCSKERAPWTQRSGSLPFR